MNRNKLFCLAALMLTGSVLFAAKVDTVETRSQAMGKAIKAVVITPDGYETGGKFPVVYLLHGHSGNYANWVDKAPGIKEAADRYGFMIVCPDGDNSWYWDSPVDKDFQYETYVVRELVPWIDKNYHTIADRRGRAITGLSMGGHGALYLAFRNQEVFGAAGSTAGGVDIRPFPNNWNMAKRLGSYAEHPERWEQYTVINMLHLLTPNALSLIIDCGTADFFYGVNERLHAKLLERNIPHDYITRPGGHTWEYWTTAISHQLLFFSDFFTASGVNKG